MCLTATWAAVSTFVRGVNRIEGNNVGRHVLQDRCAASSRPMPIIGQRQVCADRDDAVIHPVRIVELRQRDSLWVRYLRRCRGFLARTP